MALPPLNRGEPALLAVELRAQQVCHGAKRLGAIIQGKTCDRAALRVLDLERVVRHRLAALQLEHDARDRLVLGHGQRGIRDRPALGLRLGGDEARRFRSREPARPRLVRPRVRSAQISVNSRRAVSKSTSTLPSRRWRRSWEPSSWKARRPTSIASTREGEVVNAS